VKTAFEMTAIVSRGALEAGTGIPTPSWNPPDPRILTTTAQTVWWFSRDWQPAWTYCSLDSWRPNREVITILNGLLSSTNWAT